MRFAPLPALLSGKQLSPFSLIYSWPPSTTFTLPLDELTTMSTPWILHRLYTLDPSSLDFLRHLYCLIQHDEEDQYLSSLQGPELTRLVDFLDEVRALLLAFFQLRNGLCRPSVPFPPTTKSLGNVYGNYKPSVVTARSYHPHTSYLMRSPESVMAQSPLAPSPMYGKVIIVARESRSSL